MTLIVGMSIYSLWFPVSQYKMTEIAKINIFCGYYLPDYHLQLDFYVASFFWAEEKLEASGIC